MFDSCWEFDGGNFSLHFVLVWVKSVNPKEAPRKYDDDGVMPTYAVECVLDIFSQIRRLSEKLKEVL